MSSRKAVRVRVAFQNYSVGDIFYPTGIYRDELIGRGLVERAEEHDKDKPKVKPKPRTKNTRRNRTGKRVEMQTMSGGEARG